ncbi:MAG: hypothetical protein B7733_13140 [Myxococcales bacterium FL481]|nr:MAG: hypothetical protein B7733_13140 [Myxococcales bacterium FL481]
MVTSDYALCEAARNLDTDEQKARLEAFSSSVIICADLPQTGFLYSEISLPEKDWPILLAAMESGSTHLLTGDKKHFGEYFNTEISGVRIMRPAEYLNPST